MEQLVVQLRKGHIRMKNPIESTQINHQIVDQVVSDYEEYMNGEIKIYLQTVAQHLKLHSNQQEVVL